MMVSVKPILEMLVHIADLNAADVKARHLSRTGAKALTLAQQEELEWEAFRATLDRRRIQLGGTDDDIDEDEADALIALLAILDLSKTPLTIFEVMRSLQMSGVLSLEFAGPARAQALAMLGKLRVANRVFADQHGRWAVLR
jgi:hypothetical protein